MFDPVSLGLSLGTTLIGASKERKARKAAARRAALEEAAERQRQQRIADVTGLIDRAYDSPERQKQYADYATALRSQFGEKFGRAKGDASRGRKFELARKGQIGGSVDVDTGRRLGQEFEEAALMGEQGVRRSVSDLQDADYRARLETIKLAQGGLDPVAAQRRAGALQQQSLADAYSQNTIGSLGDIFTTIAGTAKRRRERPIERAALYGRR